MFTSERVKAGKINVGASGCVAGVYNRWKYSDKLARPFFGGSIQFSSSIKRGAILATPDPIECIDTREPERYEDYVRTHIQAWAQFFGRLGSGVKLGDIIVVTGVDRTTSWANAVFNNVELAAGLSLSADFAQVGEAELACQYTWQNLTNRIGKSGRGKP